MFACWRISKRVFGRCLYPLPYPVGDTSTHKPAETRATRQGSGMCVRVVAAVRCGAMMCVALRCGALRYTVRCGAVRCPSLHVAVDCCGCARTHALALVRPIGFFPATVRGSPGDPLRATANRYENLVDTARVFLLHRARHLTGVSFHVVPSIVGLLDTIQRTNEEIKASRKSLENQLAVATVS